MNKMNFKFFTEAAKLIREDRFSDLQDMALEYLGDIKNDADGKEALEKVISVLNEPIIRKNIEAWAEKSQLSGLPLVNYVADMFIRTRKLPFEKKVEITSLMADGNPIVDVKKMIKASSGKIVNVSSYYTNKEAGEFIMNKTRTEQDKQLLKAPTNIGAGEVTFIILGNLQKPTKGDLEVPGIGVIEVKTPGAAIAPKAIIHPSKTVDKLSKFIKRTVGKDVFWPSDKKEAAALLSFKYSATGRVGGFPLADWAKENDVPLAKFKKIFDQMHIEVYKTSHDASNYIKNDYSLDTKGYGRNLFGKIYIAYKEETKFDTLTYYDFNTERLYSITSEDDARKFFDKYGEVTFNFKDAHGRDANYGAKISSAKSIFK